MFSNVKEIIFHVLILKNMNESNGIIILLMAQKPEKISRTKNIFYVLCPPGSTFAGYMTIFVLSTLNVNHFFFNGIILSNKFSNPLVC